MKENKGFIYQNVSDSRKAIAVVDAPTTTIRALIINYTNEDNLLIVDGILMYQDTPQQKDINKLFLSGMWSTWYILIIYI